MIRDAVVVLFKICFLVVCLFCCFLFWVCVTGKEKFLKRKEKGERKREKREEREREVYELAPNHLLIEKEKKRFVLLLFA